MSEAQVQYRKAGDKSKAKQQNMKYLSVRLTAAQVRAMSFMSTKSLSKNMNIYVYIWYSIESVVWR